MRKIRGGKPHFSCRFHCRCHFCGSSRQRSTREENRIIREGKIPEEWKSEENTNKLRQKDTDAHWAVKNGVNPFGFKNHAKADANSKLIVRFKGTSANVHNSQALRDLLDQTDQVLYADSPYSGKDLPAFLPESLEIQVNEKGTRDYPLTEERKENNRRKTKVRCKVEHVFAQMEGSMHEITVRSIGMERANFNVGMMNLVYNFKTSETLLRQQTVKGKPYHFYGNKS